MRSICVAAIAAAPVLAASPAVAQTPREILVGAAFSARTAPSALAQVEAALQSKWRSLRVVAIEVMGCWGGPEQIAQLEAMVAARPSGQNHRVWEREAADAAAKALRRLAELRQ